MNLKHPYEKHLAEKLVQLPPPGDPDQNWQQMKSLLDANMPRGGGGKGPGGSYRWWVAGTVVAAVVVGTWFGGKQLLTKEQRNETVAGTIKTVNTKTSTTVAANDQPSAQQPATSLPNGNTGQTTTNGPDPKDPKGAAYASVTNTQPAATAENGSTNTNNGQQATAAGNNTAVPGNNTVAATDTKSATANNNTTRNNNGTVKASQQADHARSSEATANNDAGLLAANNAGATLPSNTTNNNNKTTSDRKNVYSTNKTRNETNLTTVRHTAVNNTSDSRHDNAVAGNNARRRQANEVNDSRQSTVDAGGSIASNEKTTVSKGRKTAGKKQRTGATKEEGDKQVYSYKPVITLPSQPSNGDGLKESPVNVTVNYTNGTIVSPSGVITREFTYYTQADLLPNATAATEKSNSRKANHNDYSSDDGTFALGLSLPLAFPLGDQEALSVNRQGGMNTISDYIPSPHVQYHFNNRTYLQMGVQFAAPQFIRPILLYEREYPVQSNAVMINTTYARKLYYFNLPVTVHTSALRNFYLGAGLQFSSLVSGVAQVQQVKRYYPMGGGRPPEDFIMSNYYTKFKHDSLSNRFNSSEIRLLLDVSYYWNRFTVGLQYNQAFNNYVSFQVSPAAPYTFDKNKSLQFYLRYNIWEDKKRKNSKGQSMLTLK